MEDLQKLQILLNLELTVIGVFVTIGLITWQISLYRELQKNTLAIQQKETAFDAVEASVAGRTMGSLVDDRQRKAQVNEDRKPILRELELLRQEREFIKDKLWFTKN
ncbi:MAG TPA: hypothetical protein VJM32_05480 [Candidatus Saccharimonadales bacterium]|nr:hypothetical protein [Candidatus Saccharimonadales bacterium]